MACAFTWASQKANLQEIQIASRRDLWFEQELERRHDGDDRTSAERRRDIDAEWRELMEPIIRQHVARMSDAKDTQLIDSGWSIGAAIKAAKPAQDADAVAAYHITVRPDAARIDFAAFYLRMQAWLAKARFNSYHLAFEQKATDVGGDLGRGFHAHIVAYTSQRSDNLRIGLLRVMGTVMSPNALSIMKAATPQAIVQDYLLAHKSRDGHKEATRETDAAWRRAQGLRDIYTETSPLTRLLRQPIKTHVVR